MIVCICWVLSCFWFLIFIIFLPSISFVCCFNEFYWKSEFVHKTSLVHIFLFYNIYRFSRCKRRGSKTVDSWTGPKTFWRKGGFRYMLWKITFHISYRKNSPVQKMVFCYRNCSDQPWEKIVLVIENNFQSSRLKAENLQNVWDH